MEEFIHNLFKLFNDAIYDYLSAYIIVHNN